MPPASAGPGWRSGGRDRARPAYVFQDQPATLLIAHDITERKKSEAALAESEARKAAILETSLDAILCIDQSGRIREWNPAAERIFGYLRAQAIDQPMDKLVVPASLRERYLPGLADYLATGVGSLIGRPIELTARRANNEEFPIELAITRSPPGSSPLFTVFVRDITERKRVEEGLRQSEARKAAILETSLDAIVSVDHEGKIIEWNPTAAKIFGYSLPLALGRDLADLILPRSAAGTERLEFIRLLRANRGRLDRAAHGNDGDSGQRRAISHRVGDHAADRQRRSHLHQFHPRHHGAPADGGSPAHERGALPAPRRHGRGLRHLHARCPRAGW